MTALQSGLPTNLRSENQVFVIPVGSVHHPVEEWFDAAQSRFARAIPSIRMVESFNLDAIIECVSHPESLIGGQ